MKKVILFLTLLLTISRLSLAQTNDLPAVQVKLENNRIAAVYNNKSYFYPAPESTGEGIDQIDTEHDLNGDGKNEYVLGVQLYVGNVHLPIGEVLICDKAGDQFRILDQIDARDHFDKFEYQHTKGAGLWLLVWTVSGMHCDGLKIVTYKAGRLVTVADKSSPAGVDFKISDTGVPQIWVGYLDQSHPEVNYATGKRLWEVGVWDGEKFIYDSKLSTQSHEENVFYGMPFAFKANSNTNKR